MYEQIQYSGVNIIGELCIETVRMLMVGQYILAVE